MMTLIHPEVQKEMDSLSAEVAALQSRVSELEKLVKELQQAFLPAKE